MVSFCLTCQQFSDLFIPFLREESSSGIGENSKQFLQASYVLVHYHSDKTLVLTCDASLCGIGAVLAYQVEDGSAKPIGFVSWTLSPAKLDQEGLAVMFGVQKYCKCIYGWSFTICTDQKPLILLFSLIKAVPQMASPRIQR